MSFVQESNINGEGFDVPGTFKSPVSVLWNITSKCELFCRHCYYDCSPAAWKEDLSDEQLMDIAGQMVDCDVVNVFISGGEPLMKRDMLKKILPVFAEKQIITCLITSGFGITEEDAELFEKCHVQVVVGLDGATPEMHDSLRGNRGAFEHAVAALRLLAGRVPFLKVEFLLTSENTGHIGGVVDLAADIGGVDFVEIHTLMERGGARSNLHLQVSQEQRQKAMEIIAEKSAQYNNKPYCVINDPTMSLRRLVRTSKANTGAVIESNGNVLVNPWVPVIFGSLKRDRLIDIWNKGLNRCWKTQAIKDYLKGMRNANCLGSLIEKNHYQQVDFYSLNQEEVI